LMETTETRERLNKLVVTLEAKKNEHCTTGAQQTNYDGDVIESSEVHLKFDQEVQ